MSRGAPSPESLRIEVVSSLAAVDPAAWDRLVPDDHPFVEHTFLSTLERSGAVGPRTGWDPCHLLVRRGAELVAAAPLYRKSHSYGEYIFDWAWAQAASRARIPYYPKLTGAVPFTPATGPRLLGEAGLFPTLAEAGWQLAEELGCSSVHWLFLPESQHDLLRDQGWASRATFQYHWENPGTWRDFADYTDAMSSKRRKEVRRERAAARAGGLEIEVRTGDRLGPEDWAAMERFYRSTIGKMGGSAYLPPAFFRIAPETLRHRALMAQARRGGELVAGALAFRKGRVLYGRYWGADIEQPGLHFELCYYALIEWALSEGITRFEAGAQGEHKLARGFLPRTTWSVHRFADPRLSEGVGRFLAAERAHTAEAIEVLEEHGPFREAGRAGAPDLSGGSSG